MKNTFFGLMLMASGMFALSSCSNDIAEEAMDDLTQGIQPGTPMNFALDFGGSTQKSGKRRINYDDRNFAAASVPFKFEVGDIIGVECPDAEKDNEELGREGRASRGVYKVVSLENIFNAPHFVQDLEAMNDEYLYWSKANLHRVFAACPAGKLTLGPIQGDGEEFTRSFEGEIASIQTGAVTEETIRIGDASEDGYRCVDKNNMIFAGSWCYYREAMDEESMVYLPIPMSPCFTSLDVIFKKAESAANKVTIKSVSVKVELPEDATIQDIKIAGKCSGTVENGRDGFIVVKEISPDAGASDMVTLNLGTNGYEWAQDKPLSTVLIMFPWPNPKNQGGGAEYKMKFPAQLKVVYQYEGEEEQTKYMSISGEYGINARNRVIVPTLPHAGGTNS